MIISAKMFSPAKSFMYIFCMYLLLFAVNHVYCAGPDDTLTNIELLSLLYSPEDSTKPQIRALLEGFSAALHYVGNKTNDGRTISVFEKDDSDTGADVESTLTTMLTAHPDALAIVGPYSDVRLARLLNGTLLSDNKLICLSPYTGSSAVRVFSEYTYFIRADPQAETLVLLQHATSAINVRRIGFMYLTGQSFGDIEYVAVKNQLKNMGREEPIVYVQPYTDTSTGTNSVLNETAFNEFANQNPQAIIVFGQPGTHVQAFVQRCLLDPRTANSVLLGSSGLGDLLLGVYKALASNVSVLAPQDDLIVLSSTNIMPQNLAYNHIKVFRKEMEKYISDGCSAYTIEDKVIDSQQNIGELMAAGWLSGRVVLQTLNKIEWSSSRTAYQKGLFEQNRYIVEGDFVFGDYGGACDYPSAVVSQGGVCSCNQGGRTTFIKKVKKNFSMIADDNTVFTYPTTSCYSTDFSMPVPVSGIVLNITFDETLVSFFSQVFSVLQKVCVAGSNSNYRYNVASTLLDRLSSDQVDQYGKDHVLDFITGPMVNYGNFSEVLVIEPIYSSPYLNSNDSNIIRISPTIEQQTYVLYSFFDGSIKQGTLSKDRKIKVTAKGMQGEAEQLNEMIRKTAVTFSLSEPEEVQLPDSGSFTAELISECNIVLGFDDSDVESFADFLDANTDAHVVVMFQDLLLHYDAIVAAFKTRSPTTMGRFITMSSFPDWADTSDAAHEKSPTLKKFHTVFTNPADYTPVSMQSFIVALLINQLSIMTAPITAAQLKATLYSNGIFALDDVELGRYSWCTQQAGVGSECSNQNYGAQNIVVTNILHILNPTAAPNLYDPITPVMVYTEPEVSKGLSKGQIAGIVVGCVAFLALLVGAIVLIVCCCCNNSRDNKNAPKKLEEPVTLIFTDIESSTALWAAVPQIMPDAVATHHRLIRQLIEKYKCYEVKTIGDSFMIACKDAFKAVQLAQELQQKFLKHDWETDEIDEAYHSFELRKADDSDDYEPPTANMDPDVYNALWHGIRVRVGIHSGLSDIRCDDVTGGYDYYGETSNMAARTEAIGNGGQVVMTENTFWSLSDAERSQLDYVNMGPQGLRGVPYAVIMYQLNAIPGRTYAPLRTEIEAILPDDGLGDDGNSEATDALLSSAGTLTGPAAAISAVLSNCFSPYPPSRRVKELQPLLEKWSIPVPPRNRRISEEDYCQGLLNRLAIKMSTVAQMKQKFNGLDRLSMSGSNQPGFSQRGGSIGQQARPSSQQGGRPVSQQGPVSSGINAAALARLASRHASLANTESSRRNTAASTGGNGASNNVMALEDVSDGDGGGEKVALRKASAAAFPADDVPLRRLGNRKRTQGGKHNENAYGNNEE